MLLTNSIFIALFTQLDQPINPVHSRLYKSIIRVPTYVIVWHGNNFYATGVAEKSFLCGMTYRLLS
jgi:hypothetical protein